ncbi:MAG: HAMP domain-containing sensor histidine kinase [Thermoguttaceae bacterium]
MTISKNSMGHDLRLWPMLSLLLIVVLTPTACLLWFMNRAIENERLAMRTTLEDAYRRDLADAQKRLEQFWRDRVNNLDIWGLSQFSRSENGTVPFENAAKRVFKNNFGVSPRPALTPGPSPETGEGSNTWTTAKTESASAVFAQCVRSHWADSVICHDAQGRLIYPAPPVAPSDQMDEISSSASDWSVARRLEYTANDPAAAAKAYATIARETNDVNLAARALQAQARCLVQSGDRQAAVELITGALADEKYYNTIDSQGRLIVPNAQLMAIELMGGQKYSSQDQLALRLQKRQDHYNDPEMTGSQRLFLMQELKQLTAERAKLPLLSAEELAARFIELNISPARPETALQSSPMPGVWYLVLPDGHITALWRTETILSQSNEVMAQSTLPGEVAITLRPPNAEASAADVFYSLPAGKYLPNWQMSLSWLEGGPSDAAANRRIAIYLWTGILVIAAIGILAGLMAQAFRNQLRHARLKNNLVATVSHELKTPLSSIRLLVDTLLDEKSLDLDKTREYLQLIAKENTRLSRLIDNFLAFSRMERNKHAFQFADTSPATIINEAVDAVRERFDRPGCRLEVDLSADLPAIKADVDALVTVVLNLLDNAYKYTGDEKHIVLRAYSNNGNVCSAVTDNGIGLSRAAAKKIFQRFYQVDRRLSRSAGGCGLGLSIVKFVVTAHGGSVEVASRPNAGSTFTVKLPLNHIV